MESGFGFYDEKQNTKVRNEWNHFIKGESVTPGVVRPEILQAWRECRKMGIDPSVMPESDTLIREDLDKLLEKNRLMCDTAIPFMKTLYDSISGPYSEVVLFNNDCIPLTAITSDYKSPACENDNIYFGVLHDKIFGYILDTVLCARYKKPFYCFGEENYMDTTKDAICTSAPILDEEGNLLGVLTISTKIEYAHWHTLGMVISAAKAISDEILLREKNEQNLSIANQLTATIESVPQGMLVLDSQGVITHVNSCAKKILYVDDDIQGKCVNEVLIDQKGIFSNADISFLPEQEISLKTSKGMTRYFVTAKKFSPPGVANGDWTLVILKEFDYAKDFTNNVTNSYSRFSFSDIEGNSKKLEETISLAQIAARSTSTVLITGPSGTGKELFAHSIHSASKRSNGPFVSINCGALPAGLVESELFGYERGAFTGAKKEGQIGKFELANHGTLFLDEIGEMPLSVQASLLRVIETKEVTRIGSSNTNILDVRIIAATNKDLIQAIKDKEFREDLYYRLNVLRIAIPSLGERKEDIPVLADRFLKIYTERLEKSNISISDSAYSMLLRYDYPGNVRELENIIERAVNICDSDSEISSDILKLFISMEDVSGGPEPAIDIAHPQGHIRDVEKELIIQTLIETGGSVSKTAEKTGIGRRTLYRKFQEYDINYTEYRNK